MGGRRGNSYPAFQTFITGIQVFTIKADLHDVGLTTAKTPFGHLCLSEFG